MISMKYEVFYRRFVTRTWDRFRTPVTKPVEEYELPRASAIHYVPESNHEFGIDLSHSLMRNIGDKALVYHIDQMDIVAGKVRHLSISPETMIRNYHKRYRNLIRVRNFDKSNINDKMHMVVNYALLPHLNIQLHSNLIIYQEWQNLRHAMWKTMEQMGPERFHIIPYKVPKFIPGKAEFKRYAEQMTVTGLKHFHTKETFDLLELWQLLEYVSEGKEIPISQAIVDKTLLVFIESGNVITIQLKDLLTWAKEEPAQILQRFYVFMDALLALRTTVDTDAIVKEVLAQKTVETEMPDSKIPEIKEPAAIEVEMQGDEDLAIHEEETKSEHDIEKDLIAQGDIIEELAEEADVELPPTPLTPIEERIQERALAGALSGAEQRGLTKLSEKWKTIPNPFNPNETLGDMRIEPDELALDEKPIVKDIVSISDKSMLKSKVVDFDKEYVTKVMHKDVINMALSIQQGGVIVKDLKVTEKKTAATEADIYSIQLQPIAGKVSTIKFTIPKVREDGTFKAGGVKYRMDKQRGEMPIVKVKPHTVALTSYYGKSFIVRNQNASTNYARWIKNKIVKASIDNEDNSITDVTHGLNKFNDVKLPRMYTAVAEEMTAFSSPKYQFFWNYKKMDSFFTEAEINSARSHELIPVGRSLMTKAVTLGMDKDGIIYELRGSEITVLSSLPTVINPEWGEGPMEYAEIGIFNRRIPIILALIYKKGIDATFKDLGINYTRIPPTARYAATPQTYRLKFKDESFIIDVRKPEIRLLIAGFNAVRKNINEYSSHELNKRSSFNYLLSGSGITQHHLRELLLMFDMFIDSITMELLVEMKEPTTFEGLLIRANEMLIDDWVDTEEVHRFKGYERFAGMAYGQIVASMRSYRAKGNIPDAEVTMNPSAVWLDIIQDQSITLVEDSNPIHNCKEKEAVTFSGSGGRSTLTMVKETRGFKDSDLGIISESTPDSGKVGIRTYMTANPNLLNLRGVGRPYVKETDGPASVISTTSLLAPGITHDDGKRVNFTSVQNSSTVSAVGYEVLPFRTGYEQVLANRVDKLFASSAKEDGKVIEVTEQHIRVQYNSGAIETILLGKKHGVVSGTTVPHMLTTDMRPGQKFKQSDILAFNQGFFKRDIFDPGLVSYKAGAVAKVVFWESTDTNEDGCVVTSRFSEKLTTPIAYTKPLIVDFKTAVHNLVKVGDHVEYDSILCTLEDAVSTGLTESDPEAIAALQQISSANPKAKCHGVVTRIEVVYYGKIEEMHPTLQAIVKADNKSRSEKSKLLNDNTPTTGEIDETIHFGGTKLLANNVGIKIYIDTDLGIGAGDKLVFGNQLKTTISRVESNPLVTEDGQNIDAIFGYQSVANRIVYPELAGTMNVVLRKLSAELVNIYKKG